MNGSLRNGEWNGDSWKQELVKLGLFVKRACETDEGNRVSWNWGVKRELARLLENEECLIEKVGLKRRNVMKKDETWIMVVNTHYTIANMSHLSARPRPHIDFLPIVSSSDHDFIISVQWNWRNSRNSTLLVFAIANTLWLIFILSLLTKSQLNILDTNALGQLMLIFYSKSIFKIIRYKHSSDTKFKYYE